ncbi:FHA domain-containing protein [Actinacidiphila rubida]|uniref:FHA domain-containing protein n=1 Tax=Actinacidiphila rubida TaxID=310780 RepID=UPI002B0007F4|nr:FHA domain-containing protein [Actinacidiphila rubida]
MPPTAPGYPPYQRHESQRSRPSQINRPAEPVPSESVTLAGSGDFLLEPPSVPVPHPGQAAGPAATAVPSAPAPASSATAVSPAPSSVPTVVPQQPDRGTSWTVVVAADREYFTAMMARSGPDAQALYFPAFSPEVRLPLDGHQVTIGRRRHSTGEAPDIDLSRAPEDPGVSHQHAVLVRQADGTWSVVDQDSTNGTTVNLAEESIRPYTPVPLAEGDRVHVGAWTTITLMRA